MAYTSNDRYFAYTTYQMNLKLADFAYKEISPVEIIVACALEKKDTFFIFIQLLARIPFILFSSPVVIYSN